MSSTRACCTPIARLGPGTRARRTEALLRTRAEPHPAAHGWYTENYTRPRIRRGPRRAHRKRGAGQDRIRRAGRLADAAVAVLTTPGHEGRLRIAGDSAYTLAELAAESRGRRQGLAYVDMPPATTLGAHRAGVPAPGRTRCHRSTSKSPGRCSMKAASFELMGPADHVAEGVRGRGTRVRSERA